MQLVYLLVVFFPPFVLCRAPEPQKPHTKPLDDVVRSNHYDPDEDEEYYRKQLSYFDRRSFDSKAMGQPPPGINRFHDLPKPAQLSYPYNRYKKVPHASSVGRRPNFLTSLCRAEAESNNVFNLIVCCPAAELSLQRR